MGIVLVSLEKIIMEKILRLSFPAINNEGEYEALLVGMAMASKLGGKAVEVFSDSRLVVGQINGDLSPGTNECKDILPRLGRLSPTLKFSP